MYFGILEKIRAKWTNKSMGKKKRIVCLMNFKLHPEDRELMVRDRSIANGP